MEATEHFGALAEPYILVVQRGHIARLLEVGLARAGYTVRRQGSNHLQLMPYVGPAIVAVMRLARPALLICYADQASLLERLAADPDVHTVPVLVFPSEGRYVPPDGTVLAQLSTVRLLREYPSQDELVGAVAALVGPPPGHAV